MKPGTLTIARKPLDAQDVSVDAIPDQTYAGAAIEPALSVRHGAMTLVAGRDYTASYADNVNAGAAKVIVAGMGNYAGERTVDFTIVPQNAALEVKENRRTWSEDMSLDEAAIRARFEVNDANGRPLDGNLYTVRVMQNGADAKLPIVNAGNYTVEVALNTRITRSPSRALAIPSSRFPSAGA